MNNLAMYNLKYMYTRACLLARGRRSNLAVNAVDQLYFDYILGVNISKPTESVNFKITSLGNVGSFSRFFYSFYVQDNS